MLMEVTFGQVFSGISLIVLILILIQLVLLGGRLVRATEKIADKFLKQ